MVVWKCNAKKDYEANFELSVKCCQDRWVISAMDFRGVRRTPVLRCGPPWTSWYLRFFCSDRSSFVSTISGVHSVKLSQIFPTKYPKWQRGVNWHIVPVDKWNKDTEESIMKESLVLDLPGQSLQNQLNCTCHLWLPWACLLYSSINLPLPELDWVDYCCLQPN